MPFTKSKISDARVPRVQATQNEKVHSDLPGLFLIQRSKKVTKENSRRKETARQPLFLPIATITTSRYSSSSLTPKIL